jgi:hypothetical protein
MPGFITVPMMKGAKLPGYVLLVFWIMAFCPRQACAADAFVIQVLDEISGRGVPLVELRTVNKISFWTDSAGVVAFNEPGLMNQEVFFSVQSPGYELPADGFGKHGAKFWTTPGRKAEIRLQRSNIAERLYRITGQGIYRDSLMAGLSVPLQHPDINGQVMGQDTVIATPYQGKLYWFWGDTDKISHPIGHFGAAGATSEFPGHGGLDPSVGIDLNYFIDSTGFSKPMCIEPKEGLHWIQALFTVPDTNGVERLLARMAVHKDLGTVQEWRVLQFNDQKKQFDTLCRWDLTDRHESSHPFRATTQGTNYFYLFPDYRVPATYESIQNLGDYEVFTCIAGDGKWRGTETKLERNADGILCYTWKKGADCHRNLSSLQRANLLKPEETWSYLIDFETGKPLAQPISMVAWNEFCHRWIALFPNQPGEVWYAEADTPLGPWGYARRIATHGNYNFYNITHHDFFNQEGGKIIYFEGTYTATFSGAKIETPRYDYNQLMYRLALDDKRLNLPVAVYPVQTTPEHLEYLTRESILARGLQNRVTKASWFAMSSATDNTDFISIYTNPLSQGGLTRTKPSSDAKPIFVGLNLEKTNTPATTVLWQYQGTNGQYVYTVSNNPPKGCNTPGIPLCRVWRTPGTASFFDWSIIPINTTRQSVK